MARKQTIRSLSALALLCALLCCVAAPALAQEPLLIQLDVSRPGREGPYSPEDFHRWQADWADRLPLLLAETGALEPGNQRFSPVSLVYALSQTFLLPGTDMASPQAALEAAREAILALPGWTEGKLAMYVHQGSLVYQSQAQSRPLYQVLFAQKEAGLGDFSSLGYCTVRREYGQPLDMMFGGLGDSGVAPWYVSVLLDAVTLELIAPPAAPRLMDRDWVDPYWQLR